MVSNNEASPSQGGPFVGRPPRVLVGVSGGIAAYKSAILVRRLKEWGAIVKVAPTPASLEMVGKVTWEALSGNKVHVGVAEDAHAVEHVKTGHEADLIVIAPATANTLAKIRSGIADNMLTASVLVADCPIIVAPAMHTEMWNNPATRENVSVLRDRGIEFAGPVSGRLTGKDSGAGRMMEPEDIADMAIEALTSQGFVRHAEAPSGEQLDLVGTTVLVSTGGTHEPIDPVRYIGNRSSGRMGVEIAKAAHARGARTVVVGANIEPIAGELSGGIEYVPVQSALELQAELTARASDAEVIIMAAAVSDFRVDSRSGTKLKRDGDMTLQLRENPDILSDLAHNRRRENQLIIGFAAETGDATHSYLDYGKQKAARKGADFLAVNQVGDAAGFGDVETRLTLIDQKGDVHGEFTGSKRDVAGGLVAAVAQLVGVTR